MSYLKCASDPEDAKSHCVTINSIHHYDLVIKKNITNHEHFFPYEKDIFYSPKGHTLVKLQGIARHEHDALIQIMNADQKIEQRHVNLEDIVEQIEDADRE